MRTFIQAMKNKYGYHLSYEEKHVNTAKIQKLVLQFLLNQCPTMTNKDKYCIEFYNIINDKKNIKKRILPNFIEAFKENPIAALKMALYLRDVKEGIGARKSFRTILTWVTSLDLSIEFQSYIRHFLYKIPVIGRWDDIFYVSEEYTEEVFKLIKKGLADNHTSALCAKWMPRKGFISIALRKYLGETPYNWRKLLVRKTELLVENKICARKWDEIEFDKLSSNNLYKYKNTFRRHCSNRFIEYIKTRPLKKKKEIKVPSIEYIISNERYRI